MTDLAALLARALTLYAPDGTKTLGWYTTALQGAVRDLYNGGSEYDFIDSLTAMIEAQLGRAWREGARDVGVEPDEFTADDDDHLQTIISSEYDHVLDFAQAISDAAAADQESGDNSLSALYSRADLWANRYTEVVNEAHIWFGQKERLEWQLGDTEKSCKTCSALDGIVAFGSEWEQAGLRPQQPPNSQLECEGWRCDCRLVPTDRRRSPRALDTLLTLAVGKNT